MIESYKSVVKPYAYSMPDQMNEPLTEEQYEQVAAAIPGEVEKIINCIWKAWKSRCHFILEYRL